MSAADFRAAQHAALTAKAAKQRNEIGRLMAINADLLDESKRRRILLVNALHGAPGWKQAIEQELNNAVRKGTAK